MKKDGRSGFGSMNSSYNLPEEWRQKLEIRIRDEFIKLGQALKLADLVSDGVEAKYVISDGLVKVNGEVDTRRGRKVYGGDVISYNGQDVKVLSGNE